MPRVRQGGRHGQLPLLGVLLRHAHPPGLAEHNLQGSERAGEQCLVCSHNSPPDRLGEGLLSLKSCSIGQGAAHQPDKNLAARSTPHPLHTRVCMWCSRPRPRPLAAIRACASSLPSCLLVKLRKLPPPERTLPHKPPPTPCRRAPCSPARPRTPPPCCPASAPCTCSGSAQRQGFGGSVIEEVRGAVLAALRGSGSAHSATHAACRPGPISGVCWFPTVGFCHVGNWPCSCASSAAAPYLHNAHILIPSPTFHRGLG